MLALRVWAIVLTTNIVATWVFAGISAIPGIFPNRNDARDAGPSAHAIMGPFWHTLLTGGSAGWLIGLMVWLLPIRPHQPSPDHHPADLRHRDLPVSPHHRRIGGGGVRCLHRPCHGRRLCLSAS